MTDKFNCILAFGDSHVAGCELSNEIGLAVYLNGDITLEEADSYGKQFAFPKILGDKLGIPCYNFSLTGGSNARSIRKLINSIKKYSNPLIIFGYTSLERYEFYYPDEGVFYGRDNDNYIQVGPQWSNDALTRFMRGNWKIKHPINDIFVRNILRPNDNLFDIASIVKSICKANGKSVIHLPLFPFKEYPKYFFDFEGSKNYLDWCSKKGFEQLEYWHYGIEAHNALADLLFEYIKKNSRIV